MTIPVNGKFTDRQRGVYEARPPQQRLLRKPVPVTKSCCACDIQAAEVS